MGLMIRTERETGTVHTMLGRIVSSLSARQHNLEGMALLSLPCGTAVPVKAAISFATSPFSRRGEGHFLCDEQVGFDAMAADDWPTLAFAGEEPVAIAVISVKTTAGHCRCLFEVKS